MQNLALQYTKSENIDAKIKESREFFYKRQFELANSPNPQKEDLEFRLSQLRSLYWGLKDHEDEITKALEKDFHRSRQESIAFELIPLYNNILDLIEKLPTWIKNEKIHETGDIFKFSTVEIQRIPLGSVLIISPFNFPVLLGLDPVASAIASGNSVVWKPSELVPHTAALVEKIVVSCLSPGLIQVIQGGVPETTRLLQEGSFDKIFYTGSTLVGSIVAQEAAKKLTPCILELGGKSPVFITESFPKKDLRSALKRIFFSAFCNSGQVCVAADYILVHKSHYKDVVSFGKEILNELWPQFDENSEFSYCIHDGSYQKTLQKLEETKGITFNSQSASFKKVGRCIPPTLIFDVSWNDSLMKEENFAPVLPFLIYEDLDEVIDNVVELHDYPLAMYIFAKSDKEINHILRRIRSGACVVGDTMIHVSLSEAPFGGVRTSGYGSYHGKWSYTSFTHERTLLRQPFWIEALNSVRYPPYSNKKIKIAQFATEKKPSFDRKGSRVWNSKDYLLMALTGILVGFVAKKGLDNFS
ncbi:LAFE_0C09780g1_1 [Lachancea fermentati]|uniref:Aldehyde dehydrogenase n=1 Tax=Lachancea fermentati TaxID=4955 RepID=A0A1G4M9Y4_LACFM|nr:LAFE_0C09780g1_1 [Lachancea fermentati]